MLGLSLGTINAGFWLQAHVLKTKWCSYFIMNFLKQYIPGLLLHKKKLFSYLCNDSHSKEWDRLATIAKESEEDKRITYHLILLLYLGERNILEVTKRKRIVLLFSSLLLLFHCHLFFWAKAQKNLLLLCTLSLLLGLYYFCLSFLNCIYVEEKSTSGQLPG